MCVCDFFLHSLSLYSLPMSRSENLSLEIIWQRCQRLKSTTRRFNGDECKNIDTSQFSIYFRCRTFVSIFIVNCHITFIFVQSFCDVIFSLSSYTIRIRILCTRLIQLSVERMPTLGGWVTCILRSYLDAMASTRRRQTQILLIPHRFGIRKIQIFFYESFGVLLMN